MENFLVRLELRIKKIKTNLRLHSRDVTYIRYILDSQFIPVSAKIIKKKKKDLE